MWWKKYEPLLEQKPISGAEAVKDLVARELVEMLEAFPPDEADVAWEDPALEKRLRGRLAGLPRLDAPFVELLARIVTLDLQHEIEAIDHTMRNDLHREAAPTPAHVDALHMLWRAVVEQLYQRKDEARGVLKGKDLVDIVEKMRARFAARAAVRT